MGNEPTLGILSSEQQQTPTAAPIVSTQQLPLATELPPWDLVPADTLLVRRRPASK